MAEIFVGMMRRPWDEVASWTGHILCSCGQFLTVVPAVREHWQMGHFDYPVYKDVDTDEIRLVTGDE